MPKNQNNNSEISPDIDNALKTDNFLDKLYLKNTFFFVFGFILIILISSFFTGIAAIIDTFIFTLIILFFFWMFKKSKIHRKIFSLIIGTLYCIFLFSFMYFSKIQTNFPVIILSVPIIFYFLYDTKDSLISGIIFILIFWGLFLTTNFFGGIKTKLLILDTAMYSAILIGFYFYKNNIMLYYDFITNYFKEEKIKIRIERKLFEFSLHQMRTSLNNLCVYQELVINNENKNELEKYKKDTLDSLTASLSLIENISNEAKSKHEKYSLSNIIEKIAGFYELQYANIFFRNTKVINLTLSDAYKQNIFLKILFILLDTIKNSLSDKKIHINVDFKPEGNQYVLLLYVDNLLEQEFYSKENKLNLKVLNELMEQMLAKFDSESSHSNEIILKCFFEKDLFLDIEEKEAEAENEEENGIKISRLLIADDDDINQKILQIGFQKYFQEIDIASNGAEVLQFLTQKKYDLLLMDLQMPKINGIEAIGKIREMEKITGQHIQIIGISANALIYNKEEIINFGFDDFFIKPFKIKEIYKSFTNLIKI